MFECGIMGFHGLNPEPSSCFTKGSTADVPNGRWKAREQIHRSQPRRHCLAWTTFSEPELDLNDVLEWVPVPGTVVSRGLLFALNLMPFSFSSLFRLNDDL